jgi:hypothetical protein
MLTVKYDSEPSRSSRWVSFGAVWSQCASLLQDKQARLHVVHRAFYHVASVNGACDRADTFSLMSFTFYLAEAS